MFALVSCSVLLSVNQVIFTALEKSKIFNCICIYLSVPCTFKCPMMVHKDLKI
jgi:hypothetical protein